MSCLQCGSTFHSRPLIVIELQIQHETCALFNVCMYCTIYVKCSKIITVFSCLVVFQLLHDREFLFFFLVPIYILWNKCVYICTYYILQWEHNDQAISCIV